MSWKLFAILCALIVFLTFSPMLGIVVAGTVAQLAGCTLDGSSVNPCIIGGADYGKTLYGLSLMGWRVIETMPLGAGALALLVVVQAGARLFRKAR